MPSLGILLFLAHTTASWVAVMSHSLGISRKRRFSPVRVCGCAGPCVGAGAPVRPCEAPVSFKTSNVYCL